MCERLRYKHTMLASATCNRRFSNSLLQLCTAHTPCCNSRQAGRTHYLKILQVCLYGVRGLWLFASQLQGSGLRNSPYATNKEKSLKLLTCTCNRCKKHPISNALPSVLGRQECTTYIPGKHHMARAPGQLSPTCVTRRVAVCDMYVQFGAHVRPSHATVMAPACCAPRFWRAKTIQQVECNKAITVYQAFTTEH